MTRWCAAPLRPSVSFPAIGVKLAARIRAWRVTTGAFGRLLYYVYTDEGDSISEALVASAPRLPEPLDDGAQCTGVAEAACPGHDESSVQPAA